MLKVKSKAGELTSTLGGGRGAAGEWVRSTPNPKAQVYRVCCASNGDGASRCVANAVRSRVGIGGCVGLVEIVLESNRLGAASLRHHIRSLYGFVGVLGMANRDPIISAIQALYLADAAYLEKLLYAAVFTLYAQGRVHSDAGGAALDWFGWRCS